MQTYDENIDHDNLKRPDWLLFLRALRGALRRWKIWGATWLVLLLLSLVPALMTAGAFDRMVGSRYPNVEVARSLGRTLSAPTVELVETFRTDHSAALSQLNSSVGLATAGLGFFAFLFGVFAAGGWLQITFEQPHRQTLRRFGFGGARYFGRFLRVAIMTLLLLALVRWLFYGDPWRRLVYGWIMDVPKYDWGRLETLESEKTVVHLTWLRDGLAAIGFAKVMAWAIYTRTRMALRDGRSALGAGFATWFTMVRHPIQTFRPLILLFAVEALVVLVIASFCKGMIDERLIAGANGWHVLALAGVAQFALIWRQITRGAYYHAAGRVSQSLIRPTDSRPDPWATTIGGPGGPQYPVTDDGYHVTI